MQADEKYLKCCHCNYVITHLEFMSHKCDQKCPRCKVTMLSGFEVLNIESKVGVDDQ